jgi:chemotaxis protein MotB|tara:strand:- start:6892 stop:8400 length:1509 start_codon:yes stop_codon:yes gene_type:complete
LSKQPPSQNNKSLYPNEILDTEDDNSWQVSYLDIITIILGFLIILLSLSEFTSVTSLTSVSQLFKSSVQETEFLTTPIEEIQSELEASLSGDLKSGEIEIIRDLNDLLIRFSSDDLYRSGSATLQQGALPLFDRVISAIKSNRFNDFNVEVEGHTDNTPISSSAYPSNWELSTTRATNVVKYFRGMGIEEGRLKASGYADSKPLVPNEDASGNSIPRNKALNRRVDIRLYYASVPKHDSTSSISPVLADNNNCRYSVQIGGFQSFNNSFSLANDASRKTNYSFEITFNNNLFSVRSEPRNSLEDALKIHKELASYTGDDAIGLIHQCYEDTGLRPDPIRYQIQVAAFQNKSNAERYISEITSNLTVLASISSTDNGSHKVMLGPYQSPFTASEKLAEFKKSGLPEGIFIKPVIESILPYSFNFRIQLAKFENRNDAEDLSQSIASLMGLQTEISEGENEAVYLLTGEFQDWKNAKQVFNDLRNSSYDLSPVLYLLEQVKPPI